MHTLRRIALAGLACAAVGAGDNDSKDDGPILPRDLANLKSFATAKAGGKPLFLFVYSDTCPTCKQTAPGVITAWRRFGGQMGFVTYDITKKNKPDPAVEGHFKIVGPDGHHRTVIEEPDSPFPNPNERRRPPPGQRREGEDGRLEITQATPYAEYVSTVLTAYDQYAALVVRRAFDRLRLQQEAKERAGNNAQMLRYVLERQYNISDVARFLEDPFAGIADRRAVDPLIDGIEQSEVFPAEPINALVKLGAVKTPVNAKLWETSKDEIVARWKGEWLERSTTLQVDATHKEIDEFIRQLTDSHRYVCQSAYQELERLTGMDFIFNHWGTSGEKSEAQKLWREWYGKSKKDLKWNADLKSFATKAPETKKPGDAPGGPSGTMLVATSQEAAQAWRITAEPPAVGWEVRDFDESVWKEGPGPLGAAAAGGRTEWGGTALWARKTFDIPESVERQARRDWRVQLHLRYQGDVVVYLNGHLLAKRSGRSEGYEIVPVRPELYWLLEAGRPTGRAVSARAAGDGGAPPLVDVGLSVGPAERNP
jgi:hypothetical protein